MSKTLMKADFQAYEDWVQARAKTIGSSDVATLLGVNPYKGASWYALWARMVHGVIDDKKPSTAMRIGTHLEPLIGEFYTEATTRRVTPNGMTIHYNEEYPECHATPDFEIVEHPEGCLEGKSVGLFWAKDWKDGVPPHVIAQAHHQMRIMELDWVDVGVIIGGRKYETHTVMRDTDVMAQIREAQDRFLKDYVKPKKAPDVSADDLPVLKLAWSEPEPGKVIELDDPVIADVWDMMAQCDKVIAEQSGIKNTIKAQVQRVMEDAEVLRLGNGAEFLWKQTKQGRQFRRGKGAK